MGKMISALLIVFVLELTMFVFQWAVPNSSLFTWLIDPSNTNQDFSNVPFLTLFNSSITSLIGLLGLGIVLAVTIFIRIEGAYAIIAAAIFTFMFSIIHFWVFIYSQAGLQDSSAVVATMITAPLLIFYVITVIDWIRRPD